MLKDGSTELQLMGAVGSGPCEDQMNASVRSLEVTRVRLNFTPRSAALGRWARLALRIFATRSHERQCQVDDDPLTIDVRPFVLQSESTKVRHIAHGPATFRTFARTTRDSQLHAGRTFFLTANCAGCGSASFPSVATASVLSAG